MTLPAPESKRTPVKMAVVFVATVLLAVVIGVTLRMGAREQVLALLAWIEGHGLLGMGIFLLIQIAIVVLLLPGIVMTMGAGFLFGVGYGSLLVLIGTTIGALIAFSLARYGLGPRVHRYLEGRLRLQGLDRAVSEQGWKVILITRMIPFFPFKLSNYVFGVMQVRGRDLAVGTLIGCIPLTVINVYAGSLAADIATLQTNALQRTPWQWAFYAVSFLVVLGLVVWIGARASRYYDHALRQEPPS